MRCCQAGGPAGNGAANRSSRPCNRDLPSPRTAGRPPTRVNGLCPQGAPLILELHLDRPVCLGGSVESSGAEQWSAGSSEPAGARPRRPVLGKHRAWSFWVQPLRCLARSGQASASWRPGTVRSGQPVHHGVEYSIGPGSRDSGFEGLAAVDCCPDGSGASASGASILTRVSLVASGNRLGQRERLRPAKARVVRSLARSWNFCARA